MEYQVDAKHTSEQESKLKRAAEEKEKEKE